MLEQGVNVLVHVESGIDLVEFGDESLTGVGAGYETKGFEHGVFAGGVADDVTGRTFAEASVLILGVQWAVQRVKAGGIVDPF